MRDYDAIDGRLQAVNRVPGGIEHTTRSEDLLDEIGAGITVDGLAAGSPIEKPRRAMRWRWPTARRGALLASMIGLLVLGGGAAAGTILTTYTGDYNKGRDVESGGPGQNLLMGAPNFCRAALKLSSDISYPAGYGAWRPWVLIDELQQPKVTTSRSCGSNSPGGEGKPTLASTGALRGWFAMSAFCAWTYDWREAESSGDQMEAAHAASAIAGALRWPAVLAEDPHPSAAPLHRMPYGLDGGHSLFGWFIPFQSAVKSNNARQVSALIKSHYGVGCSQFRPPADSHGGTLNPLAARAKGHS